MQIAKLYISKFRGIKEASILLPKHAVIIGDNNIGKTTIIEAIDLALGPDRLNRNPPVDEHDFYLGEYTNKEGKEEEFPTVKITIEVVITELSDEQKSRFQEHLEFWDSNAKGLVEDASNNALDADSVAEALRVKFIGYYDQDEDDFFGKTFFSRSFEDDEAPTYFTKKDKQVCGFLYLRTLRTGSRALSLERGSLLDIILRLRELRPRMWEDSLTQLKSLTIAEDPEMGIVGVLESVNLALQKYVPKEWGVQPHLKISTLTRDHLRKVITAFIATGEGNHSAPFYRQGTGTINMLVLALLSEIAKERQNVIFAMEEPETAIPPYAQKRIVHEVRELSSQTIFTSHSPYVLEEFEPEETVVLAKDAGCVLSRANIDLPASVKLKRYRQEFRTRFCEGLLTRRILIAEGATEALCLPTVFRRLAELNPAEYKSFEALGVCVIDAGGDTNISALGKFYGDLGKVTFAVCDKQPPEQEQLIRRCIQALFMHEEKGFENLILNNIPVEAMQRYLDIVTLPESIIETYPDINKDNIKDVLSKYFKKRKGEGGIADLLSLCTEEEIPEWLRRACKEMINICGSSCITGNETK